MEEECCESLRKRVVLSEDRISELPEPLILRILSLLPTKLVIATSVLSKRWRSLWKMVPNLEFESHGNKADKFAEGVCKSLLSHKAPALESFHLKVRDRCDEVYIGIMFGIAFTRHVREFVLDLGYLSGKPVRLPSSLFCFDKLETLKLKDDVFVDVPSPVSMKSLRTLYLHSVVYKDNASLCNLLSSCPNLEHLVLHHSFFNRFEWNLAIVAPSLKTFSLYDPTSGAGNTGYLINAPSLKYLNIEGLKGYEFCLIDNEVELVEANIRNVSYTANDKIMGSLKSVKRLSLDLSPLQIAYPAGVIFYQLVYLEMYTHKKEWWNLLTLVLESSPKLQNLKLVNHSTPTKNLDSDKKNMEPGKWNEPEYVPECLLSHLETFVWTRHDWMREEEKEVAIYILKNALQLKKAIFSIYHIEPKRLYRLKKRREMLTELAGVARASPSCDLVFESE